MAQMTTRTIRDRSYNEAGTYQLIPTFRREVVPNQTMQARFRIKMQTAAFSKNILTSALVEHHVFYVPYRLLWDDWVKFITRDDDYAGTFPAITSQWNLMWDKGGTFTAFMRRAYKLVYNEYFGSHYAEDASGTGLDKSWYDDITADSNIDVHRVMTTEQMMQAAWFNEEVEEPTYSASPINLLDFDQAMQDAKSGRRARKRTTSGNLYVDLLKSFGANASWAILQRPERIAKVQEEVFPAKTFDTSAASTGNSAARYEHLMAHGLSPWTAPEHGLIIGVAVVRPHVFNQALDSAWDGLAHSSGDVESFFLGDNERGHYTKDEAEVSTGADVSDKLLLQRHQHLLFGQHLTNEDTWSNAFTPADFVDSIYIDSNTLPVGSELSTREVAVASKVDWSAKLPIRAGELI